jgi:EAL and modified HD-GYP domain-containing signal transduction protein
MTSPAVLEAATSHPAVVRQPICDRGIRVAGYELLVQGHATGSAEACVDALADVGMDLVAAGKAWIPVGAQLALSGLMAKLPHDRVVIVAAPDALAHADACAAIAELQRQGFDLAVEPKLGETVPLAEQANWIIVDGTLDHDPLVAILNSVRGRRARLIAKGLDTYEQFDLCKSLDLDLYQGSFFTRPRLADGAGIKVNTLAKLKLIADLHDPNVDMDKLGKLVSTDIGLSHGLLRYVNSASLALPRRIESVQHALVMLGLQHVRRWMTTMALADSTAKPQELLLTGLVRAQMMERIAVARGHKRERDSYFTVGLFSVIDGLTDTAMAELLAELPLAEPINAALLDRAGPMGDLLAAVVQYESGDFDPLYALVPEGARPTTFYRESVEWATEARAGLTASPDAPTS